MYNFNAFLDTYNCSIVIDATAILYDSKCASIYNNIGTIFEVSIYIICVVFDVFCLIKLRKLTNNSSIATEQDNKRNRIMVIQVN